LKKGNHVKAKLKGKKRVNRKTDAQAKRIAARTRLAAIKIRLLRFSEYDEKMW
jgi:hypothetical protein